MKKRIVFICSNLSAGGAQNVVTLTSEKLVSIGYDVTIITFSSKKSDFYKKLDFSANKIFRRLKGK